ncbi:ABC transporter substrate-binding protein [Marinivivus vitaminiproducens]|uniref:ABC transporter substrate-binding protein n=1 Tax=Marinivivus vitaminiproducens TaxID=3035935 RepID=UPI0027A9D6A9|nr:ABC transporter substrate-binding protein [Geminicoccaceae bacterium SCSIO 64248]
MSVRGTLAAAAAFGMLAGSAAAQDAESYTIGVSIPAATHGWAGGMNYHANQAIERLGEQYPNLEFVLSTANGAAEQVSQIEDMVAVNQIDGLVVLPFESEPLTPAVQSVAESGAFVTVVDRGLSEEGIEDLYVAGDNPGLGRVSGEYFLERLPDGGKIVALRGIPTTIDNERFDAFTQAIEGSSIELLDSAHADWNRDDAFTVMQDFLARYPEIDAVWAQDDDQAIGVLEAINQSGREDIQFVVGGAGMKEMVKRVMDGDAMIPVDVTYPPAMIATAIELTALHFTSPTPIAGSFVIGSELITQENAEAFYFPDSPF